MLHSSNGNGTDISPPDSLIDLKEAIAHLWKRVDADHIETQKQLTLVQEKLDLWIRTNQLLLESNQSLLKAVVENSQETQRLTRSFDRGSQLLTVLENRISDFGKATIELNGGLQTLKSAWEKVLGRTPTQNQTPTAAPPPSQTSPIQEGDASRNNPGQGHPPLEEKGREDLRKLIALSHRQILAKLSVNRWLLSWALLMLFLSIGVGFRHYTQLESLAPIHQKTKNP